VLDPLPFLLAGLAALAAGALVLRSFGPGYRIGRILAATPAIALAEALALAAGDRPRYVRVAGRIDAADEFEDESGRPLVLHRLRTEVRSGRAWRLLEEQRRAVPFRLDEGTASIGIDVDALDAGLVVIPRESVGLAGEVPGAFEGLPATTPVRLRIEQVSSVDHAVACGVPHLDDAGRPTLGAGLGRPLILTTLEREEAMRVLAAGSRLRPLAAAASLATGTVLLGIGLVLGVLGLVAPPAAAAATPGTSTGSSTTFAPASESSGDPGAGDTRSPGTPPGVVGDPLLAVGGVLAIGIGAAGATLLAVRLTGGGRPAGAEDEPRD
jgi:hypothetical protein